jgi:hypothetical protein
MNARKIAATRVPAWQTGSEENAYAAAIREVAQPIADERDEYREALEAVVTQWDTPKWINAARAVLEKYPKP